MPGFFDQISNWRDGDERDRSQPKEYFRFAGSIEVEGIGTFRYEAVERDFNPGPESACDFGSEPPKGPITVLKTVEEKPVVVWGHEINDAEENLRSAIQIRERFKNAKP